MQDNYVIFNPEGGLGKVIASTALLPLIKQKYPQHKIVVITPWPEAYLNNPFVFRVFRPNATPYFYKDYIKDRDSIVLKGEPYFVTGHLYQRQHLIKSWCDLFDLPYDENALPMLKYTSAEINSYSNLFKREKPILVFQTNGGPYKQEKGYCWTRDFPPHQAQILVNELSKTYHVIQVSRPNTLKLQGVEYVEEVPNKRSLLAMLLFSKKRLLIDSCMQHAAAAFKLPSTVAWIGTSDTVFGYNMHNNVHPNIPKIELGSQMVDSQFFDYDFNGPEHEFPYGSSDLFNLQQIFDDLTKEPEPEPEQVIEEQDN